MHDLSVLTAARFLFGCATRAANDALPMRDAFAVLFFVSVGMLFDAKGLINPLYHWVGSVGGRTGQAFGRYIDPVRLLGEPWTRAVPTAGAFHPGAESFCSK
jgi:CPA2 family monovalent cation:H+ antiporter-2